MRLNQLKQSQVDFQKMQGQIHDQKFERKIQQLSEANQIRNQQRQERRSKTQENYQYLNHKNEVYLKKASHNLNIILEEVNNQKQLNLQEKKKSYLKKHLQVEKVKENQQRINRIDEQYKIQKNQKFKENQERINMIQKEKEQIQKYKKQYEYNILQQKKKLNDEFRKALASQIQSNYEIKSNMSLEQNKFQRNMKTTDSQMSINKKKNYKNVISNKIVKTQEDIQDSNDLKTKNGKSHKFVLTEIIQSTEPDQHGKRQQSQENRRKNTPELKNDRNKRKTSDQYHSLFSNNEKKSFVDKKKSTENTQKYGFIWNIEHNLGLFKSFKFKKQIMDKQRFQIIEDIFEQFDLDLSNNDKTEDLKLMIKLKYEHNQIEKQRKTINLLSQTQR